MELSPPPAMSREATPTHMTASECWEYQQRARQTLEESRRNSPQVGTTPQHISMLYATGHVSLPRFVPRPLITRCWLCEYAGDPDERKLSKYVQDNVALIGTDQMAFALQEELFRIAPGSLGTTTSDIRAHITTHMLNPTVRVASILRTLLDLVDKLSGIISTTSDDGVVTLDSKNISVYLNVVNEVMKLYKTGEASRLMFGDLEKKSVSSINAPSNGQ